MPFVPHRLIHITCATAYFLACAKADNVVVFLVLALCHVFFALEK